MPPKDNDSDRSYSYSSGSEDESHERSIFVDPTISRNATLHGDSSQRELFSQLKGQLQGGGLRLNNSDPTPIRGRSEGPLPQILPQPVHLKSARSGGRGPPPPPPPPGGMRNMPPNHIPGQRPPIGLRPGMGHPQRAPVPVMPKYPLRKVNRQSKWRYSLKKERGSINGAGSNRTGLSSQPNQKLVELRVENTSEKEETNGLGFAGNTDLEMGQPEVTSSVPNETAALHPKSSMPSGSQKAASELKDAESSQTTSPEFRAMQENSSKLVSKAFASGNQPSSVVQIIPPKTAEKPDRPSLAETLSGIAETHLKIDILDETNETSRLISYLLDTIQLLEAQISFKNAAGDPSPERFFQDQDDKPKIPHHQTLHRIFCNRFPHAHNASIYKDEPVFHSDAFDGEGGIMGEVAISNLETYLDRHPGICFIVFKEHKCFLEQQRKTQHRLRPLGHSASASAASDRGQRLRIVSPLLEKALIQVAEFQVYAWDDHDNKEMDAPYTFLFHHRKRLVALAEQPMYKEVLTPLLDFLDENYGSEYQEVDDLLGKGMITANHIEKLFKPNQMVINRRSPDGLEAFVLKRYAVVLDKDKITLQGWSWHYDGTKLQRVGWNGKIDTITDEETPIADLAIHPIEFARSEDIEKLDARGKKFWDLNGQHYTCYTGWDEARDHHYTDARFMVDVTTYQLMHPKAFDDVDYDDTGRSRFDTWPETISRRGEVSEQSRLLLPMITYGFNLQEKKWVVLFVDNIRPVDWNKKAFDRLVLDMKTKEMIYALVDVQTSTKKMDDIITGKGNGLIILLHGSPGTGKTLTAESVAEIAEKPLYRVTCGDIGTEPKDVEKYLQTVLYLGKIWDCVLLLDEADVFLEERTMADLQRNSLVSVFLRILEYYEGILILTSNRVGTFDEAFKSRIQVAIHYDNLTKKSRKAIWRNFFDMIEDSAEEDANMPELERRLDELAAEEMNGRQIRNALLTARQLAKHRRERLDWEHLSQVMKTSAAFNKYLKAVRGHSDDQWAREEMLR